FFFFFQAEDGIRDKLVTGVQTCALPISFQFRLALYSLDNFDILDWYESKYSPNLLRGCTGYLRLRKCYDLGLNKTNNSCRTLQRSEERRVGKECRSEWEMKQ